MKILSIAGHGAGDSGAIGCGYKEADLTREFVNILAPKLRAYATVDIYDMNRNAYRDVQNGTFNIGVYGYVLEVHFNAFKKDETQDGRKKGSEIYVTTRESGITVEQAIMKNISAFFPLRDNDNVFDGVKRTNFAVINKVKSLGMSGALLEVCFIDDADDMKTYQENKEAIADAVVKGIVEEFGLKKSNEPTKPSQPTHSFKYNVGQKVRFSTCYTSASNAAKCIDYIPSSKMTKDNGTITKQYNVDGVSAYLLDNGLCFVNDGDIREVLNGSSTQSNEIKVRDSVIVTNPVDVNGTRLSVSGIYEVVQINGDRIVIGRNGVVTAAIHRSNLKKA